LNDVLTRDQFKVLLLEEHEKRIKDSWAQVNRQMLRFDTHHEGHCSCPDGEPHGVRLLSEDWGYQKQQELDDHASYDTFEREKAARWLDV
jgi:hypothetical protein